MNKRLGEPHSRSDDLKKTKISLSLQESNPELSSLQPSHYSDYSSPAPDIPAYKSIKF
jgi:hypothetical protein